MKKITAEQRVLELFFKKAIIRNPKRLNALINAIGIGILMKQKKVQLAEALNYVFNSLQFPNDSGITYCSIRTEHSEKIQELFRALGLRTSEATKRRP